MEGQHALTGKSVCLIDLRTVEKIVGCGKTKLYQFIRSGNFPAPCRVGKSSRWPVHEVEEFVSRCIAERNARLSVTNGPEVTT